MRMRAFAEKHGVARQRIHELIKKGRIKPKPTRKLNGMHYEYNIRADAVITPVKLGRPRKKS